MPIYMCNNEASRYTSSRGETETTVIAQPRGSGARSSVIYIRQKSECYLSPRFSNLVVSHDYCHQEVTAVLQVPTRYAGGMISSYRQIHYLTC